MLCQSLAERFVSIVGEQAASCVKEHLAFGINKIISEAFRYQDCRQEFSPADDIALSAAFFYIAPDLIESCSDACIHTQLVLDRSISFHDSIQKSIIIDVVLDLCPEHEQQISYLAVSAVPFARR